MVATTPGAMPDPGDAYRLKKIGWFFVAAMAAVLRVVTFNVLRHIPMPWLRELDIPPYYAYGSEDPNIPVDLCVEVIETLVAGGKDISFSVYPGLGHSLATWRGLLTMGFVPGYLDTVATWSARQAKLANQGDK